MNEWLIFGVIALLSVVCVVLAVRVCWLKKAAKEIGNEMAEKLGTDTNTLISISTTDSTMQQLASVLNVELEKLQKAHHRYEQGDRELKTAVTNISHDLRTPLTAICGYLSLLESEEKSDKAAEYLDVIGERTETMRKLTDELFRYSMIMAEENELARVPVDMGKVLAESLAGFYGVFSERGIAPQILLPEQKVERLLDEAALSRVFSNLLNNALKYSDGDLSVTLLASGEIVFENTASAMTELEVGKLFDRFYTVESGRNSTGLGLSIAKTLVEQMGGTIRASLQEKRLKIVIDFPTE